MTQAELWDGAVGGLRKGGRDIVIWSCGAI